MPILNHLAQVSSDDEALKLMNDSPYGLTASVWTNAAANPASEAAFLRFADELETGTVFLNRYVLRLVSFTPSTAIHAESRFLVRVSDN